ncbi:LuxR C-terminal-related transcriptional regulator [Nonomuraea sp. NPDC050643]|uniref:helix-turn-helix transcriptional regulator n=1 Tax=Nonomuraea sp. NPDC050643 TaxID=3155660 RepID=UPI00340DB9BD
MRTARRFLGAAGAACGATGATLATGLAEGLACADRTAGAATAAVMLAEAARAAWYAGDGDLARDVAHRLNTLTATPSPLARTLTCLTDLLRGEPAAGVPRIRALIQSARRSPPADPRLALVVASVGLATPDHRASYDLAVALVTTCRTRGLVGSLPGALLVRARAQTFLGHHRQAESTAVEGLHLARDSGQRHTAGHLTCLLAWLAAVSGDPSRRTAPQGHPHDDAVGAALLNWARPDPAATAFHRFDAWAVQTGRPTPEALAHRCRALLLPPGSPDDDRQGHFEAALRAHGLDPQAYEQARTELVYGRWLRRTRRKRAARELLRAARERFEHLGARPWARRAAGEPSPARTGSPVPRDLLTAQERQVTRLASRGVSNRDIAAQLFLSPRTVGNHLYNAFRKLGITSRRDLGVLLGHDTP